MFIFNLIFFIFIFIFYFFTTMVQDTFINLQETATAYPALPPEDETNP